MARPHAAVVGLTATPPTAQQQVVLVRALRIALERHGHADVALIETHISFVLVVGGLAYKIKKALRTDYLDQSTLALRQHGCEEELRLNARLAPTLYLGVVAITGRFDAPVLGGAGPAIEFAVQMRAFAQDGLWDRLARRGRLGAAQVDELARVVARFHEVAECAGPQGSLGSPEQVRAPLLDSLRALREGAATAVARARVALLADWERRAYSSLRPVLAQRLAQGHVRECHGDLHLGNVVTIDGQPVVFDGIEFNDSFRWIDVMSEVAFLAMDLHAHGLAPLAHRFVDRYLEHSGDYGGVRVQSYYLVHRALVRAKVALERAAQCPPADEGTAGRQRREARRYLALALYCCRPGRAALLVTHGFSGSGKSTLTQGLVEVAGAIRIRADVERRRLVGAGRAHEPSVSPTLRYGKAMNRATYDQLRSLAVPVLESGRIAILDATFLRRHERDQARALAAALRVPCVVLDFSADPAALRHRVHERAARGMDASEADEAVLADQMLAAEPLARDELGSVYFVRCQDNAAEGAPSIDWSALQVRLAERSFALNWRPAAQGLGGAAPPPC